MLQLAQRLRRGELEHYEFIDQQIPLGGSIVGTALDYEPSPYIDYNGANLLYFASYPTIGDTIERQIIMRSGLWSDPREWALATSTVARDIFYYSNLDLGERLQGRLKTFLLNGDSVITHTILVRARDDDTMADIFTKRMLLPVR